MESQHLAVMPAETPPLLCFARPLRRLRWGSVFVCVASGCLVSCSSGNPLGGPYGGTVTFTGPTRGNTSNGGPESDGATEGGAATQGDAKTATEEGGATALTDAAGAPTWTAIFDDYLNVADGGSACQTCHHQMMTASSAYTWLQSQGYISGAASPLVSTTTSCLSWYGGNMPPDGTINPQAVADMNAWAAAGAPND
jgi:hypothetical protein